jgi:thiamine biosynthesis lipoprotein
MKLILLLIPILLCADLATRTQVAMGTFVSVKLKKDQLKHSNNVFKIFKDIEKSISSYDPKSVVSNLNKKKFVKLDKHTYNSLKISKTLYEQTDGYFDITIGSITKDLFRFGQKEFIPYSEVLKRAKLGIGLFYFDRYKAKLRDGVKIDLGGMGKGYGVDEAIKYLKSKNIKKAVVAASGDIRCLSSCKIDINDPRSNRALFRFKTIGTEMGVSTSGSYNRYVESKKNNHLINPKTKRSQSEFISVTLISDMPNSYLDGYTTAVSVMPKQKAYRFLDKQNIAYIILQSDDKLVVSKNIKSFVNLLK